MKNENIPADIKSKSIKEAREEIDVILGKLESQDANLDNSLNEYQRLIRLNKHIDSLFKKKLKEIISKKELKKND
jgi:exonuclease VII small subunit